MKNLYKVYKAILVFGALCASHMAEAALKKQRSELGPVPIERQNLAQAFVGTKFGAGYLRRVAQKVWLGGQVSFGLSDPRYFYNTYYTNESTPTGEYDYDVRASTSASSLLGQISWLSSGDSGFVVAGLLGASYLESVLSGTRIYKVVATLNPLESVSLNQTISKTGLSGGVQLGYIWTFDSGLSLGIVANGVSTLAKFDRFSAPAQKGIHDDKVFNSILDGLNDNRNASSGGIMIGFVF